MSSLRQATFLTTVAHLRNLPEDAIAEVAFAGRSNAGKSSAINTLADHTRLAFVSKTPGRTQHLNFFTVRPGCYLVDLPGYGFAKAPEEIRGQWEGLIGPYLEGRPQLAGLILIMDCRRGFTPLDRQLVDWFIPTGRPLHILLTKSDKLTRQESVLAMRAVQAELARLPVQGSVQLFSSLKKTGVDEARAVIEGWLAEAAGLAGAPEAGA